MNLLDNLAIPTPYLIQKNTDFNFLDSFGWTLMHYAVSYSNVNKINELLAEDISFNTNSSTKKIPTSSLMCRGKDDADMYKNISEINIPYCENGYTPLHLSVFLHNYYTKRAHADYRILAVLQENIFNFILKKYPDCMAWEDSDRLTVTDYSILSFNLNFLKQIKSIDNDLQSLNMIEPLTAKKIFENEIAINTPHKNNNTTIEDLKFMQEMVIFLVQNIPEIH